MGSPTIRPARPDDKEAWLRLWQGYLSFYESQLAPEVTETTWSRLLDANEPMFCLVAEADNGQVIGFTTYVLHANTWTTKQVCYLEDLFVDPDTRGQGTGQTLIQAVAEKARELDCLKVYWMTKRDNETARALYDKVAIDTNFMRYDILLP